MAIRYVLLCALSLALLHLNALPVSENHADGDAGATGVLDCARIPGTDAGQKIAACIAELPNGGIADARRLTGTQTIRNMIELRSSGLVLLLGAHTTFEVADGAGFQIAATDVRIEGTGRSTILRLGNGSSITVGSAKQPVWGWTLERFNVEPSPGKSPKVAILLNNAREGILREVTVSRISGSAIEVQANCWSNRSIESQITQNDIGYNIHGDAANAWNIRGGFINLNRIGVNVDLGVGKLQGFTISDGTQLEGNKEAGIRLSSGILWGVFLSDVYSELFESQRLVKVDPHAAPLRLDLLTLTNSSVYAKDTPPISINTRPQDIANVNISNVFLRNSQSQMAIGEATGPHSSVLISESVSNSIHDDFTDTVAVGRSGAHVSTVKDGKRTQ